MKWLASLTWFILLHCFIFATLYQLASCVAGHTPTGTISPEGHDSQTKTSENQQCSKSVHGIPGVPGNPGFPGNPGPQGPPGLKGEAGQFGMKGEKGDLGMIGERGPTGRQNGVRGKVGPKGEKGDLGSKGSKGQSGLLGPKGQQGQPGQQGQKGDKGHAGEIHQPSRMAFSVAKTTPMPPESKNTGVIYDRVYVNVGNGYSKDTGKFTCSVSGVYFFTFTARKHDNLYMCLMKNTDLLYSLPCIISNSGDGMHFNSVIIDIETGDEVWLELRFGYGFISYSNSIYATFTGYLLYENSSQI
ncbi:complement C1q tumor necrosis factor-related protein 3-like [Ptychodera flava]|uniref:complement C1q tumor necrosis factor-related protein 3-like n=1 Tax=Ptychodera flava TaxID=63121 RepID=UPI00396AA11F